MKYILLIALSIFLSLQIAGFVLNAMALTIPTAIIILTIYIQLKFRKRKS